MADFAETTAALRAEVRRLRELAAGAGARSDRPNRAELIARAATERARAAAAAAAAEAAEREAAEAERADARAEQARQLRAELLAVLNETDGVGAAECALCALAGDSPRGPELRCDGAGRHPLCAGCAAEAWAAVANDVNLADRAAGGRLPCPCDPGCDGGFPNGSSLAALLGGGAGERREAAERAVAGVAFAARRAGRAETLAAAASGDASGPPTNMLRQLADEAAMLLCPGGCGSSYASTNACMHATCGVCNASFGSCCFGHLNAAGIGTAIAHCPLNLTPGFYTDVSRREDQVAVARAVRANRLLARRPDLLLEACYGTRTDEEDGKAALRDMGLYLSRKIAPYDVQPFPAMVIPYCRTKRVTWALGQIVRGREPDPACGTGLGETMPLLMGLLALRPTAEKALSMLWARNDAPSDDRGPAGVSWNPRNMSGAELLQTLRTLFEGAPSPRPDGELLSGGGAHAFADDLRSDMADAVVAWMAPAKIRTLDRLRPPWFASSERPLAGAFLRWSPKARRALGKSGTLAALLRAADEETAGGGGSSGSGRQRT